MLYKKATFLTALDLWREKAKFSLSSHKKIPRARGICFIAG